MDGTFSSNIFRRSLASSIQFVHCKKIKILFINFIAIGGGGVNLLELAWLYFVPEILTRQILRLVARFAKSILGSCSNLTSKR